MKTSMSERPNHTVDNIDLESRRRGHEQRDAHFKSLMLAGLGLLVLLLVTFLAMWWLLRLLERNPPPARAELSRLAVERVIPPEPRLQADPKADLRQMLAHEDSILTSYGWVDRRAGIVRIPIRDAMELYIARGVPVQADTVSTKGRP
jgi:hypothetical protein